MHHIVFRMTAPLAFCLTFPQHSFGDHVPEPRDSAVNPNYVACIMAVEDASETFRHTLQEGCLRILGDICGGYAGRALPSQIVRCLNFETDRALRFLNAAVNDLPETIERKGLFGHHYATRRAELVADIQNHIARAKPDTVEGSLNQADLVAINVTTLFWFARETNTPLQKHVAASDIPH